MGVALAFWPGPGFSARVKWPAAAGQLHRALGLLRGAGVFNQGETAADPAAGGGHRHFQSRDLRGARRAGDRAEGDDVFVADGGIALEFVRAQAAAAQFQHHRRRQSGEA